MDSSKQEQQPKPQTAADGKPPRPPKKTARDLSDGAPDPRRELTEEERKELMHWLQTHGGKSK